MEREQLEVDVVLVGAGPANLAAAYHLSCLLEEHNGLVRTGQKDAHPIQDPTILVIEKGRRVGAHILSGAVIDPRAFDELLGTESDRQPPYDSAVSDDALYVLTKSASFRSPILPPFLDNRGCYVSSLGRIVSWMGELCEQNGIEVYPEFPATELLFDGTSVIGVRTGDRGRDRSGRSKPNFEPGVDVLARVTVLGEGVRGTLTRQAADRLKLREQSPPEIYAVGVKELWKVPDSAEPGIAYHTLGYPLGTSVFGGGFLYTMTEGLVDVGLVVGLDYRNPCLDPHELLQRFKAHTFVKGFLKGGELVSYGAKAIPEGGYHAMPQLFANGLLIVGDSAGFLNSQRLKGVHLAVKSGMLAAETIFDAFLRQDFSADTLKGYRERFEASWAGRELRKVRNFRQGFQRGFWRGIFHAGLQQLSNGRGLRDPLHSAPGYTRMQGLKEYFGETSVRSGRKTYDGQLTFGKLADVFLSDTVHEEDQPCHLKIIDSDICNNRCTLEYGNPCQYFCPAEVYEMTGEDPARRSLKINFTNCVHCKTCDIMDPYQVILWTPPEGGGGPDWKHM